jgi:hypothetical protein
VNVVYGGAVGLQEGGNQLWHQGKDGILGEAGAGDAFAFSLAVGDFDDDGYADLAAGVPYDLAGGQSQAGAVNLIYGSLFGLSSDGNQILSRESLADDGLSQANAHFGYSLAAAGICVRDPLPSGGGIELFLPMTVK